MNNLSYKLNKLSRKYKQNGGGGIPFSALQQGGGKSIKRRSKKTRRSPSRKRRVSRKTSRRTKRRSNRKKIKRTTSGNKNKKCSCGSHTYTGNESTPRGAGNCEECIPLNVVLKGKDGKLYENKNNHWVSFN